MNLTLKLRTGVKNTKYLKWIQEKKHGTIKTVNFYDTEYAIFGQNEICLSFLIYQKQIVMLLPSSHLQRNLSIATYYSNLLLLVLILLTIPPLKSIEILEKIPVF